MKHKEKERKKLFPFTTIPKKTSVTLIYIPCIVLNNYKFQAFSTNYMNLHRVPDENIFPSLEGLGMERLCAPTPLFPLSFLPLFVYLC